MKLIRVRHFYHSGTGNNIGDVWSEVNKDEDWNENRCRSYIERQGERAYTLAHNEYARPTYYMVDKPLPDWSNSDLYDYERCKSRDEADATCDSGCDLCPYTDSCNRLQREQQIEWIKKNSKTEFIKFCDWLDGLLKEDCRTDRFRKAAWREAQEKDACGMPYELSARNTVLGRPYNYRLS